MTGILSPTPASSLPMKVIKRRPLGNPRRKWRQDNFILSAFQASASDMRQGIRNAKDAYFNLLEFVWSSREEEARALAACEEVGMDMLLQYWAGTQEAQRNKTAPAGQEEFLAMAKKYRHVAGYYIWDEPYHEADIRAARVEVDRMEAADPDRLPFTVAIPSYNRHYTYANGQFPDCLRMYAQLIDPPVLSLDYYPIHADTPAGRQLSDCGLWRDLWLLRQHALELEAPMWFYYQAVGDVMKYLQLYVTFPQIRMQMFNAILYGAKGLQCYNLLDPVIRRDGSRGPLFEDMRALQRRITLLGPALMALESQAVFHGPDILPDDGDFQRNFKSPISQSRLLARELPEWLSAGELADREGNRYLLVLNRNYHRIQEAELPLKAPSRLYGFCPETGRQYLAAESAGKLCLELDPGDALLIRVQDGEEDPFLIDYVLEK